MGFIAFVTHFVNNLPPKRNLGNLIHGFKYELL